MKTTETSVITVTGADWRFVLAAVTDPHGLFVPGFAHAGHHQRQGLVPADAILISDCAAFGARRSWELVDGQVADTIQDPDHNGAWHILTQDNLSWARWTSGSSSSAIEVEREDDGDTWTVTGEFPVAAGVRYEGLYWDALQAAIAAAQVPAAV
jgi:hypothetical protein